MLRTIQNLTQSQRVCLIVLTAALIGCLTMMAAAPARSALTVFSDEYEAGIAQSHIGVALTENGEIRSGDGDLLKDSAAFLGADTHMEAGKVYKEWLSVKNVSEDRANAANDAAERGTSEYVRLTVRKYWAEGERDAPVKTFRLDPSLIELVSDEASAAYWVRSDEECTAEREVFYCKTALQPGEAAVQPAVTGIKVNEDIRKAVEDYSNCWLVIDAQVDSVQVNNAVEAAKSAWGIDVTKFADEGLNWNAEEGEQ